MTLLKFIQKITKALDELRIDYVISGGVAVGVWGRPRHTADIDIVIEIKKSKIVEKLISQLKNEFPKAYADKKQAKDAFSRQGEFNLIEPEFGFKADFFCVSNSGYDHLKIKRGKKKRLGNSWIKFISPEDLILSKILWYKQSGSSRHLEDAQNVKEIVKNLDNKYLDYWYKKLDLNREAELLE